MIEIILRDDITSYKSKPFFGMSGRQLVVLLIVIAILGIEIWLLYFLLQVPTDIGGFIIVATGAGIGYIGLSERDGIALTKLLIPEYRYHSRPSMAEHCPPDVAIYAPSEKDAGNDPWVVRIDEVETDPKKATKIAKAEAKLAKNDSEFVDEEGLCISAKKARAQRGIKAITNKQKKTEKQKKHKSSEKHESTKPSESEECA